jgi:alpha-L-arabinofuranosidase
MDRERKASQDFDARVPWEKIGDRSQTDGAPGSVKRNPEENPGSNTVTWEPLHDIRGRNRCEVLSSWAAGVSYARMMNLHERHGDLLKIATLADFCGTRWQVNAIMIPVPKGKAFMMPVAKIMSLYRKHSGENFVGISNPSTELDITASRTRDTLYLHVVNISRDRASSMNLNVKGMSVSEGKAFELSASPEFEVLSSNNDPLLPKERKLPVNEPVSFPPASVTAIELTVV